MLIKTSLLTSQTIFWGLWNSFLAILPFMTSWYLVEHYQKKWSKLKMKDRIKICPLFLVWFFFFPNIPYLFLDFRHIMSVCEPASLNRCFNHPGVIMLLFAFAVVGIPLFVISLEQIRVFLTKLFNSIVAYVFIIVMIPLTALGLHFGMLERLNSWNIINDPFLVFEVTYKILSTPSKLLTVFEFSIALYFIFFFLRYFFSKFEVFFEKK